MELDLYEIKQAHKATERQKNNSYGFWYGACGACYLGAAICVYFPHFSGAWYSLAATSPALFIFFGLIIANFIIRQSGEAKLEAGGALFFLGLPLILTLAGSLFNLSAGEYVGAVAFNGMSTLFTVILAFSALAAFND